MNSEYGTHIKSVDAIDGKLTVKYIDNTITPTEVPLDKVVTKSMFNIENVYFSNNTSSHIGISNSVYRGDTIARFINTSHHAAGDSSYFTIRPYIKNATVVKEGSTVPRPVYRKKGNRQLFIGDDIPIEVADIVTPRITFKGINNPIKIAQDGLEFVALCDDNPSCGLFMETIQGTVKLECMIKPEIARSSLLRGGTADPQESIAAEYLTPYPFDFDHAAYGEYTFTKVEKAIDHNVHTSYLYYIIDIVTKNVNKTSHLFGYKFHKLLDPYNNGDVYRLNVDTNMNVQMSSSSYSKGVWYFNLDDLSPANEYTLTSYGEDYEAHVYPYDPPPDSDEDEAIHDRYVLYNSNYEQRVAMSNHLVGGSPQDPVDSVKIYTRSDVLSAANTNKVPWFNHNSGFLCIPELNRTYAYSDSGNLFAIGLDGITLPYALDYSDNVLNGGTLVRISDDIICVMSDVTYAYNRADTTDVTGRISKVQKYLVCFDIHTFKRVDSYRCVLPYQLLAKSMSYYYPTYRLGRDGNAVIVSTDMSEITVVDTDYTCLMNGEEIAMLPNSTEERDAYYGELEAKITLVEEYQNRVLTFCMYSDESEGDCYSYEWTNSSGDVVCTEWMYMTQTAGVYYLTITSYTNDKSTATVRCNSEEPISEWYYNPAINLKAVSLDGKNVPIFYAYDTVTLNLFFSTPTVLADNVYTFNGVEIDINVPVLLAEENTLEIAVAAIDGNTFYHTIVIPTEIILMYRLVPEPTSKYLLANINNSGLDTLPFTVHSLNEIEHPFDFTVRLIKDNVDELASFDTATDAGHLDIQQYINSIGTYTLPVESNRFTDTVEVINIVNIAYSMQSTPYMAVSTDTVDANVDNIGIQFNIYRDMGVSNPPATLQMVVRSTEWDEDKIITMDPLPDYRNPTIGFQRLSQTEDSTLTLQVALEHAAPLTITHDFIGRATAYPITITLSELVDVEVVWDTPSGTSTELGVSFTSTAVTGAYTNTTETSSMVITSNILGVEVTSPTVLAYSVNNSTFLDFSRPSIFFCNTGYYKNVEIGEAVTLTTYAIFPTLYDTANEATLHYYIYDDAGDKVIDKSSSVLDTVSLDGFTQDWLDSHNGGSKYVEVVAEMLVTGGRGSYESYVMLIVE